MKIDSQTKAQIKIVYDYLALSDPLEKADVIFIAGGSTLYPVFKAAELFKKGLAPKIVTISDWGTFSNPDWKEKGEAFIFHQELLKLGIPDKDIYWLSIIKNSLEEAQEALPFMKKNKIFPQKMILVDRPVHQRREFATFVSQNPDLKIINCPADEPFNPNQETLDRVVAEMERLEKYAKEGDLTPQTILLKVEKAWKNLQFKVQRKL